MTIVDMERLRQIKTLPSLVKYLRDDLDWPIDTEDVEDIVFDYDPTELGFEPSEAVQIKEVKQLRPLDTKQPWGIFWVNFEKKRLPVVMLRRVLGHLVVKKRASANKSTQRAWHLNDLLFMSAYGEEHDRAITLAHFWQDTEKPGELPVLKVLGWDNADTIFHLADAHHILSERLRWPDNPSDIESWRKQWAAAFPLRHREVIQTTQQLVSELARLAVEIRKRTNTILARESKNGPVRRLYASFQATLIHDLTEDDFADVIAQTVTYGLLAAKFSRPAGISVSNLVDMIPPTNPFLRELLTTFLSLAGRKGAFDFDELGFQDVVELLNEANTDAVKADFGNRTRNEDPIIHFYEHFLSAYDKKKKVQRGVFYTPQPVVSYIIRSVHELLQTEFGLEDGLASTVTWGEMVKRHPEIKLPKIKIEKKGKPEGGEVEISPDEFFVQVLDIATGTATFLVEVIEVIFNHLQAKWNSGTRILPVIPGRGTSEFKTFTEYWNVYVPYALLPRLYGYELMMAPYTIAHMKIGLKLSEINARLGQPDYQFKFEGRAHIYLTNSLEPASDLGQQDLAGIFPALAHEAQAVNAVKRNKCFTVIVGNPPYAVNSANKKSPIDIFLSPYKESLNDERNLKPLNDDYVKFLRLSQLTLHKSTVGLLGMITNHSYTSARLFRAMRRSLLEDFGQVWFLDLRGEASRDPLMKEDKNVFDIQQGVGISIYTLKPHGNSPTFSAFTYDLKGKQEYKYAWLLSHTGCNTPWEKTTPSPEFFLFRKMSDDGQSEYMTFMPLNLIFKEGNVGYQTHRDEFVIDIEYEKLVKRIEAFKSSLGNEQNLCERFAIRSNRDWSVMSAHSKCKQETNILNEFRETLYRPFDVRHIFYVQYMIDYDRRDLMRHMFMPNLGLLVSKVFDEHEFTSVFVSKWVCESKVADRTRGAYLFPLRLTSIQGNLSTSTKKMTKCSTNICIDHLIEFRGTLGAEFRVEDARDGTEASIDDDCFQYIYAILYSPTYRRRYTEHLKINFPRIPVICDADLFRALAGLGGELVALHLMESPRLDKPITKWKGTTPSSEVEKVIYTDDTVWIDKAQTEGFRGVPENVWNFHIGGYQVCEKWLKDRKGRKLSADDITHYQKIVVALAETIRLMAEIDKVIEKHGGWPGAFLTNPKDSTGDVRGSGKS